MPVDKLVFFFFAIAQHFIPYTFSMIHLVTKFAAVPNESSLPWSPVLGSPTLPALFLASSNEKEADGAENIIWSVSLDFHCMKHWFE